MSALAWDHSRHRAPAPACYNPVMSSSAEHAFEIRRRLLARYGAPEWRPRLDPLAELVSTILSQNTNDINRDRAYDTLRARFPTWEAVRDAPQEEVVESVRAAGLAPQKGPRIQQILREISEQRGALDLGFLREWPPAEVRRWLLSFKGVGPKTAAIVMLFALDLPAFPVDTHVQRLSGRLGLRPEQVNADQAHALLEGLFAPESYEDVHLNLIHHGRQTCHARKPACSDCFLTDLCVYYAKQIAPEADR